MAVAQIWERINNLERERKEEKEELKLIKEQMFEILEAVKTGLKDAENERNISMEKTGETKVQLERAEKKGEKMAKDMEKLKREMMEIDLHRERLKIRVIGANYAKGQTAKEVVNTVLDELTKGAGNESNIWEKVGKVNKGISEAFFVGQPFNSQSNLGQMTRTLMMHMKDEESKNCAIKLNDQMQQKNKAASKKVWPKKWLSKINELKELGRIEQKRQAEVGNNFEFTITQGRTPEDGIAVVLMGRNSRREKFMPLAQF